MAEENKVVKFEYEKYTKISKGFIGQAIDAVVDVVTLGKGVVFALIGYAVFGLLSYNNPKMVDDLRLRPILHFPIKKRKK